VSRRRTNVGYLDVVDWWGNPPGDGEAGNDGHFERSEICLFFKFSIEGGIMSFDLGEK
jgi:hypothetical protein